MLTAPHSAGVQPESDRAAYLISGGLLLVIAVVLLRSRRREQSIQEVYW